MGNMKGRRAWAIALVILVVGILAAIFLMLGPPRLLAKSETPDFCAGCHVMEAEYDAWAHAGAHRRKVCVDCHLPNQNMAAHYVWKSIDGMKDTLAFYSGRVPERIEISAHGKEVVQANCIRCHESTVAHINKERLCWQCHRRIAHRGVGQIQTL
ncbi:MAG: cytochrome c nitrite reductase small subunit [Desulfobulbaceae bacterium]|nr:cytochrome c nitrite reductase small subunit [Desulfobulbaceae bacterium]HIJ91626.1 cytochrome c nitrite reductase small subunit [Deltaproteobacteria bacterium]